MRQLVLLGSTIFALVSDLAWAQESGELRGRLFERGTRTPLAGVNIFVLPHNLKATTEADGSFVFPALPFGNADLVVNSANFERLDRSLQFSPSFAQPLRLYLQRVRYDGAFETTIIGQGEKRDLSRKTLSQQQFLNLPGAGGDPIKAVQNLPGVNRSAGFSSNVVIQGSEPQATGYWVDGHEVPLIFHFGGLSTIVFPEAIESVEYLSAGYGPEYSRALGGLVGVKVRAPRTDRWHGLAFADLIQAGALIEGPISNNSGLLLSARQSYIGDVLSAVVGDSESFNFTVAPRYSDLTAIYDWRASSQLHFRLTGIGSQDQLKFLLSEPVNDDPALRGSFENLTQFARLIPQLEWRHSTDLTSRYSVGAGWTKFKIETDDNLLAIRTWTLTPKAEVERQFNQAWKLYAGLDNLISFADVDVVLPNVYQAGGITNPFSSGDDLFVSVSRNTFENGLYLRPVFRPLDANGEQPWSLSPGVRLDYFSATDEVFVDPRLALAYAVDPTLQLRLSGGRYHQAPEPRETSKEVGNENLAAPQAWHLAFGVSKDFRKSSEGWLTSTGLFARWFDDLVVRSNQLIVENGVSKPEFFNNSGSGWAVGSESSLSYRARPWDLMLAYTLLNSERHEPGLGDYPAQFDQTHNLNLIGGWDLPRNWRLSARARLVTGNPVTPVIGATYDADNDVFIPQRGPFYSQRLDPFFQVDLRIDKKWIYDNWILSLYLDVQNVTNQTNVEQIRYAYDYSDSESVQGLPIIPSLGIKGEF